MNDPVSDRGQAEQLAQRIRVATAGERPNWSAVRGWALELAQTAQRLQDPDAHQHHAQGVPHGPMGRALRAAHDVLVRELDDPAIVLVVQNGQPRASNYGRTVAATVANPFDLLRTIVEHNDPRRSP